MTFSTLGLAVDSSSVSAATPALDKLTAASSRAQGAADQLARSSVSSSNGVQQLSGSVRTASTDLQTLIARSTEAGRAADRMAATATASFQRVNTSIDGMRFQTAGIAAQFQDVGVTAAMGMNPLMIGLQQGTQLAGQLATMANPIKGLASAFVSLLSPVSLLTIGFTALLAAGIQWGAGLLSASKDADRALADNAMSADQVRSAISSLTGVTDRYARAIRDTSGAQTSATRSIIANSEKEFNAKKSLLELELKRQEVLASTQRMELQQAQRQLAQEVRSALPVAGNMSEAGGYSDPRVGQFVRSPAQANLLERTQELLANNPLNDKIKELKANIDLTEVATSGLKDALSLTFADSVAESIEKISEKTKKSVEEMDKGFNALEDSIRHLIEPINDPFVELQSNLDKLAAWLNHEGPAGWETYAEGVRRANLIAANSVLGSVGQITGVLAGAFEDNKAFAVANAVVNTAEAITKTLAQGGMFAFPMAAAIGAAGAAQIASILSARPGSAAVAGVEGQDAAAATAPQAARSVFITLQGNNFTGQSVGSLFEQLNDELGVDGLQLVVDYKQA